MTQRCNWATSEALAHYHDTEWGVPSRDDQHLFEMLVLEGAQAGLSWSTILNKRSGYRRAFADFEIDKVARFTPKHVDALVLDESIVRHRGRLKRRSPMRARYSRSRRNTARWRISSGPSSIRHRSRTTGPHISTRRPRPRSQTHSAKGSSATAASSSAPPSATRSCRPWAWSTTIRRIATVGHAARRSAKRGAIRRWAEGGSRRDVADLAHL